MAYVSQEARQELLGAIAEAVVEVGGALSTLGAAYEQLDEQSGDRLEEQLFRPVQLAFGRLRRTHDEFAARHDIARRASSEQPEPGHPSQGVKGFLEAAIDAITAA